MSHQEKNAPDETARVSDRIAADTYGLPPILNAEEAAAFLGLNVKTVYKGVVAGEMPGRKVRHRTIILRDALLDWLRTQERVRPRRGRSRR